MRKMRRFLAVAVLGATVALGAGAAFASENSDSQPWFQRDQSVSVQTQSGSGGSMVAGGDSTSTFQQGNEPEHRE